MRIIDDQVKIEIADVADFSSLAQDAINKEAASNNTDVAGWCAFVLQTAVNQRIREYTYMTVIQAPMTSQKDLVDRAAAAIEAAKNPVAPPP